MRPRSATRPACARCRSITATAARTPARRAATGSASPARSRAYGGVFTHVVDCRGRAAAPRTPSARAPRPAIGICSTGSITPAARRARARRRWGRDSRGLRAGRPSLLPRPTTGSVSSCGSDPTARRTRAPAPTHGYGLRVAAAPDEAAYTVSGGSHAGDRRAGRLRARDAPRRLGSAPARADRRDGPGHRSSRSRRRGTRGSGSIRSTTGPTEAGRPRGAARRPRARRSGFEPSRPRRCSSPPASSPEVSKRMLSP